MSRLLVLAIRRLLASDDKTEDLESSSHRALHCERYDAAFLYGRPGRATPHSIEE
jgi:hypothetical protein